MNEITVFTLVRIGAENNTCYTSNSIRFNSSPMSPGNLDINNGADLPFGIYQILEFNVLIRIYDKHDNCYQFWTHK